MTRGIRIDLPIRNLESLGNKGREQEGKEVRTCD